MTSRQVFIASMNGTPTNYIAHQTVNNYYTNIDASNTTTSNYQYNFTCNDNELLYGYFDSESDSETNSSSNINTNINNNGDIPPNTVSGRIEFADRVKLKFEEMMKMKKYCSHPKWAAITTVAVNAYRTREYNAEYTAWVLLTNLEEETQEKHQEKHQEQQTQTTNNSEMENVLLDPQRKFIIFTKASFAKTLHSALDLRQTIIDIYGLDIIDTKTRKELIHDKILADPFFESAKCLFCDEKNTFLVGINDEYDALRLVLMEKGGNIPSVFAALQKKMSTLNAKYDGKIAIFITLFNGMGRKCFEKDIGNICDINSIRRLCFNFYGSGVVTNICRVAVRIKIPLISREKSLFSDIIKRNNLQISENIFDKICGEKGGIFEVSINAQCGQDLDDLIIGCKQLIKHETEMQHEQKQKISPRCYHLRSRCRSLSGKSKAEILKIILKVIYNGREKQILKKILVIYCASSGYTLVANLKTNAVFDIAYDEYGEAVTLLGDINNFEQSRKLAIKATKTLKPLGKYKEIGGGYKKRFRYEFDGQQIDFALNHRTVVAIVGVPLQANEVETKLKVSEVDNIETFVSKINNLMLSNKLKTTELFRVLNEDLFALFIKKWNTSNDYVDRFVEFQSYFAKLIQWDGTKLSSQLITIISHLGEWQCNYKDKNGKIGIRKQMYWLHLLSSWCEIFMLKYDKPNEWRPTLRNERNMKELSWLLNFVLDCVNNKEYFILFVSPKVMIIDFILLYMICVHTNKYMHLFQTHLNHNGVQTLLSGIIKMDYLKNILRPYTYSGGMMQSQMPLMQIQNVQNIPNSQQLQPSIFNPYF